MNAQTQPTLHIRPLINRAGIRARIPFSDQTLWRKIKAGEFPQPLYIGTRRFWYADEVDAWIASHAGVPND